MKRGDSVAGQIARRPHSVVPGRVVVVRTLWTRYPTLPIL